MPSLWSSWRRQLLLPAVFSLSSHAALEELPASHAIVSHHRPCWVELPVQTERCRLAHTLGCVPRRAAAFLLLGSVRDMWVSCQGTPPFSLNSVDSYSSQSFDPTGVCILIKPCLSLSSLLMSLVLRVSASLCLAWLWSPRGPLCILFLCAPPAHRTA